LALLRLPRFSSTPRLFDTINLALRPFVVPFVLLLSAWVVGQTVVSEGCSPTIVRELRRRLRFRYLYVDGALGVTPQALAAMMMLLPKTSLVDLGLICSLLALQLCTTLLGVPKLLYRGSLDDGAPLTPFENGAPITLFANTQSADNIPWVRYLTAVLVAIPILTICLSWAETWMAIAVSKGLQWLMS
jgi:hypothetical protein